MAMITIGCVCGGWLEGAVIVGCIGLYRVIKKICQWIGCKCKCHLKESGK